MDLTLRIGGEAGQGLQIIGMVLTRALAASGFNTITVQDYESRIRGGHNHVTIRVADRPVMAIGTGVDLLICLDEVTYERHQSYLTERGKVIGPPKVLPDDADGATVIAVDFEELAKEHGGSGIMSNSAAAGAAFAALGGELPILNQLLSHMFGEKGEDIVDRNLAVAKAGYDQVRHDISVDSPIGSIDPDVLSRLLIKGNEAIASGAIAAGVQFVSSYPMTPSTSISEYIAEHGPEHGVWVEQAEDEIAAVHLAIGASSAGRRAMTATSGGGFALMTEALSLAGSAEIPLVVVDAQRPGPATGLPTRTEQGDLLFAVYAGHGDFPRAVLAPGDPPEAFRAMGKAFYLAEKYQTPVIVMTDQYLADTHRTIHEECFCGFDKAIDTGLPEGIGEGSYLRYRVTESGISPLITPGTPGEVVVICGDEHDEAGHLIEDGETRIQMMEKRMRKAKSLAAEITGPVCLGPEKAEVTLVCFGSTKGPLSEAISAINEELGIEEVRGAHFSEVWPFPVDATKAVLSSSGKVVVVESNYSGHLEKLLLSEAMVKADGSIRRYDGRPFTVDYIVSAYMRLRGDILE